MRAVPAAPDGRAERARLSRSAQHLAPTANRNDHHLTNTLDHRHV
jgi:hypothetical protein